MSGSNHVIAVDVSEAIGAFKETLRHQLASARPQTTIDQATDLGTLLGQMVSGRGTLTLAVIDECGSLDRRLNEREFESVLDNLARTLVHRLYSLEVPA